jgi:DNA-nicking Smr family endonuclease
VVRKRKKARGGGEKVDEDAPPKPAKVPEVGTGLKALLERAGLATLPPPKPKRAAPKPTGAAARPASAGGFGSGVNAAAAGKNAPQGSAAAPAAPRPKAPYTTGELSALNSAYRGVEPIRRPPRTRVGAPKPLVPVARVADPADQVARERLAALVGGGVRFEVRWDDGFVQAARASGAASQLSRAQSARFEPEAQLDLHGKRQADAQRLLGEFVRGEHRRGARRLLVIVGKGEHSDDGVGVLGRAAVEVLTAGVAAPLVAALASAHPTLGGKGALAVVLL